MEQTRQPTLSSPPIFYLHQQKSGLIELRSDTSFSAFVFVLETDIMRVLLCSHSDTDLPPTFSIAPGLVDVQDPGRSRFNVDGFNCPPYQCIDNNGVLTIETALLRLVINFAGFHCKWFQKCNDGWSLIAEDRRTQAYNFGWWDNATYHYQRRLTGEQHYGLGDKSGELDRTGRRFRMTNLDAMEYNARTSDPLYKSIPFLLITHADGSAHGQFYDNQSSSIFDIGTEIDNYHAPFRYVRHEQGDLDFWMIAGPHAIQVTRRFTWLTGKPALMPRWAVGYSGSTMTYTDAPNAQERMNEYLSKLEQYDIPCESFHLSSGYTSIGDKRYVFNWNHEKFPDIRGFIEQFRKYGLEIVPNIKPAFLLDHPKYSLLSERGWFVKNQDGSPTLSQFWDAVGSHLDFTNPEATAWWQEQVTEQLLDMGIKSTWNDNNEYEIWDRRAIFDGFGKPYPASLARPIQPLLMMRASRAAQARFRPQERPYVVTRSGMAGMQRYAQTWSGDNTTSWETLRYNQKMGMSLALCGQSNSGHDIGGFAGPAPDPELFIRWIQVGLTMPRFSIHSWNSDGTVNEPWMYADFVNTVSDLLMLRRALQPHLHHLLWRYHDQYEPISQPLWLQYPEYTESWIDNDSMLLGDNLLVLPVLDQGANSVTSWIPPGRWWDIRNEHVFDGGVSHTLSAPLKGLPPLLLKSNSGILIDTAKTGFKLLKPQPTALLHVDKSSKQFTTQFFDEDDQSPAASRIWHIDVESDEKRIQLKTRVSGNPSTNQLGLALSISDTREVILNGTSVKCTPLTAFGANLRICYWNV